MTFSDRLRADVFPAMGDRSVGEVAKDIGVSRATLYRFLRGDPISSRQLDAIDTWLRRSTETKTARAR